MFFFFANCQQDVYNAAAVNSQSAHEVKVNVKVHTLDIAPVRSETPPQKRSDMTCVYVCVYG